MENLTKAQKEFFEIKEKTRQYWIDKRANDEVCICFQSVISEKDEEHCMWCGKLIELNY